MPPLRPLLVIGTRPEAIKLAPVIAQCQRHAGDIEPLVCLTGQHRELLDGVVDYFGIRADYRLDCMRPGQSLARLTARVLEGLDDVLARCSPDCVVAQGDPASVLAAALAAFYHKLPLVHVEAGLRSGRLESPWPEEFHRRVAGLAATLHCAPTRRAAENLLAEGVDPACVCVTGNTVVDALLHTVHRERNRATFWQARHAAWHGGRMVLVTSHRRENQETALPEICRAIATLAAQWPDVAFVWPLHLSPHVQQVASAQLAGRRNIHLLPPALYPEFVWLMDQATLILTDSGGVQEEAPSLGKPVLVLRETTERPEAVEAGAAELVGVDAATIVTRVGELLGSKAELDRLRPRHNPFGDGQASRRIVERMLAHIQQRELMTKHVA